jgi:hypothetical protein
MSFVLGYGQTSNADVVGGHFPIVGAGLSSAANPRAAAGITLAPSIFTGGFSGITWAKTVFILTRDVWAIQQTTPYSGQLFPTGGNSGGPGEVYPF